MSSDEDPDVSHKYKPQFVPRSDDDEVLWAVQEITAERGKKYKVKWVGTDPATGKPWAQSWVAKHDCTDDLVVEWKEKQRQRTQQKRGGRSTTSGSRTRRSTTSRSVSVKEPRSPPPAQTSAKRKRHSETPTTTMNGRTEASNESRPSKKQKVNAALEKLIPPLSSDEEDALPVKETLLKVPLKTVNEDEGEEDEEDVPPPKLKVKSVRRSDTSSKGSASSSGASDVQEASSSRSKVKAEVVIRSKERVVDPPASPTFQDEEPRPQKSKRKMPSDRISPDPSEEEEGPPAPPIKIGPPRGVKRLGTSRESGASSKPGPSLIKPRKGASDGRVPKGRSGDLEVSSGTPLRLREDMVDSYPSDPRFSRLSIPTTHLTVRSHTPELSPGARARLELFDRMIADGSQPEATPPPEHAPDYTQFDYDDHDIPDTSYPPAPSPPPSNSKLKRLKPDMANGLTVPETESSRNSQSQRLVLSSQPPPVRESPRRLPTIAVIAASPQPSPIKNPASVLPSPRKPLPSINRPVKRPAVKPVRRISPTTFRSKFQQRAGGPEAPPSSIESFASPKRVDKGKQKAIEVDQLQSSSSDTEERTKRRKQFKVTDSGLRKRGQELFDRAQNAREAERLRKKAAKQLKSVDEIVKRMVSSPMRPSPPPLDGAIELQWDDMIDLTGGANSTTLDTLEHSEPKPRSEVELARLRIELRQEEEESTQEAMGIYPATAEEPVLVDGEDVEMPPPRSQPSSFAGQSEDVDHVEQPSTDIQLASVIVQPSQGQRHEDTSMDPSPATRPTSSPPRPIPENLTDSPKRRLGEALSLLNVKSEEIQRLACELDDERKNIQGLKTKLAEAQQSSVPTAPVLAAWDAERAQWTQDRAEWEKESKIWETQRKEWDDDKANLSARVTELSEVVARAEQVSIRLSELEAGRIAWTKERDVLQNEITQQSEELATLAKAREEGEQERLKSEVERVSWAAEKARWEAECTALQEKQEASLHSIDELTALVASLTSAKGSAEKDRDFFREQYTQASEFVTSVREENEELEKRTKIAEGQARDGVVTIKAFYEGRFKALQADVGRWKGLAGLLQEKDRRTNDELRLRAAQAPELGDRCGRLTAENKSLATEVRKLSRAQRRTFNQQYKLYLKIFALKKERGSLKAKLCKLTETTDTTHSVPAPPMVDDLENLDPNDMEILPDPTPQSLDSVDESVLFPCMWRPQWRDQCQHVFDAKEDLERHMQEHFHDLLSE